MIEPFWSDGAAKTRWMAIPNDGSHDTSAETNPIFSRWKLDFSKGAVLIKHLNWVESD